MQYLSFNSSSIKCQTHQIWQNVMVQQCKIIYFQQKSVYQLQLMQTRISQYRSSPNLFQIRRNECQCQYLSSGWIKKEREGKLWDWNWLLQWFEGK